MGELAGAVRVSSALSLALQLVGDAPLTGRVSFDLSLRAIAARCDRSPGTVAAHLRQLSDLGVRVCERPLVLDLDVLAALTAGAPSASLPLSQLAPIPPAPAAQQLSASGGDGARLAEVALELSRLAAAHPSLADRLLVLAAATIELAGCAGVREPVRDVSRAVARSEVVGGWFDQPTTNLNHQVSGARSDAARSDTRVAHADRASDGAVAQPALDSRADRLVRGRGELVRLTAPLVRLCRERGWSESFNVSALAAALSPWSDSEVDEAVRRLVAHCGRDRSVSSPFGLLVANARAGDGVFAALADPPPAVEVEQNVELSPPRQPLGGLRAGPALTAAQRRLGL